MAEQRKKIVPGVVGEGSFGKVVIFEGGDGKYYARKEIVLANREYTKSFLHEVAYLRMICSFASRDEINCLINNGRTATYINREGKYVGSFTIDAAQSTLRDGHVHLGVVDLLHVLNDLSHILSWMHETGFAHNDLKLANIILMPDKSVRLIDFGLSVVDKERQEATYNSFIIDEIEKQPDYLPGITDLTLDEIATVKYHYRAYSLPEYFGRIIQYTHVTKKPFFNPIYVPVMQYYDDINFMLCVANDLYSFGLIIISLLLRKDQIYNYDKKVKQMYTLFTRHDLMVSPAPLFDHFEKLINDVEAVTLSVLPPDLVQGLVSSLLTLFSLVRDANGNLLLFHKYYLGYAAKFNFINIIKYFQTA